MGNFLGGAEKEPGTARMDFFDLANLLDNDGNLQNEMMVMSFAATMLATIPILLGNEFDVNVGLKKKRKREVQERSWSESINAGEANAFHANNKVSKKFFYADKIKVLK